MHASQISPQCDKLTDMTQTEKVATDPTAVGVIRGTTEVAEPDKTTDSIPQVLQELSEANRAMRERLDKVESAGVDLKREFSQKEAQEKGAGQAAHEATELNKRVDAIDIRLAELNRDVKVIGQPNGSTETEGSEQISQAFNRMLSDMALGTGDGSSRREYEELVRKVHSESQIVGDDTKGGVLAPPEFSNTLVRKIAEVSPLRPVCMSRQGMAQEFIQNAQTSNLVGHWRDEAQQSSDAQTMGTGRTTIRAHELEAMVRISREALADSAVDLQAILIEELSRAFAISEGEAFINGSGASRPYGILSNRALAADITEDTAGDTSNHKIAFDDLINTSYELQDIYAMNATWVLRRKTVGAIRMLKDNDGRYLWTPSLQNDKRGSLILESPYVEVHAMPIETNSSGQKVIIYGDLMRSYLIYDRMGVSLLTDPYTSKRTGFVEITAWKRLGGNVIQADSLRILKTG